MNYRAPLFFNDKKEVDYDVYELLTDAQKARLCTWAMILNVQVKEMLSEASFMAEQINSDSKEVFLFGMLPNCKLYGCLAPDGSSHT